MIGYFLQWNRFGLTKSGNGRINKGIKPSPVKSPQWSRLTNIVQRNPVIMRCCGGFNIEKTTSLRQFSLRFCIEKSLWYTKHQKHRAVLHGAFIISKNFQIIFPKVMQRYVKLRSQISKKVLSIAVMKPQCAIEKCCIKLYYNSGVTISTAGSNFDISPLTTDEADRMIVELEHNLEKELRNCRTQGD